MNVSADKFADDICLLIGEHWTTYYPNLLSCPSYFLVISWTYTNSKFLCVLQVSQKDLDRWMPPDGPDDSIRQFDRPHDPHVFLLRWRGSVREQNPERRRKNPNEEKKNQKVQNLIGIPIFEYFQFAKCFYFIPGNDCHDRLSVSIWKMLNDRQ